MVFLFATKLMRGARLISSPNPLRKGEGLRLNVVTIGHFLHELNTVISKRREN